MDTPFKPLTISDVIAAIEDDEELTPNKRRRAASSLRSLATHLGRDLSMPAYFPTIRKAMLNFDPLVAGISRGYWSSLRSETTWALRSYGGPTRAPMPKDLRPEWWALREKIEEDDSLVRGLSRLMHWASRSDIAPDDVDDDVMGRFYQHLLTETLEKKPENIHQRTCVLWNKAVARVPTWPQSRIAVPSYRDVIVLPIERFPASFRSELAEWKRAMLHQEEGLFGDNSPDRALRKKTVDGRVGDFHRFASALVHAGYVPEGITGLAKLVEREAFVAGFRWFIERANGKSKPGMENLASGLLGLARYWIGVGEEEYRWLKKKSKLLRCRKHGMTQKNLERLRQFDNLEKQVALVNLPEKLVRLAWKQTNPRKAALLVQWALAIEIELMVPLRLANLVALNLGRHFSFSSGGRRRIAYLDIPAHEVKNDYDLHFELPASTVKLLELYRAEYRPHLLTGEDEGWLFPGAADGHKHSVTLSGQICKAIERHAGLRMHMHLFRHLAAKLFLDENPGQYERVRQLLGHKNIQTTVDFYCIFERTKALKRHDEVVLRLRGKGRSSS